MITKQHEKNDKSSRAMSNAECRESILKSLKSSNDNINKNIASLIEMGEIEVIGRIDENGHTVLPASEFDPEDDVYEDFYFNNLKEKYGNKYKDYIDIPSLKEKLKNF